ncbi:TonB-dependent receptor-like protein [Arcticibacter pallidicorallinus]|uniref:TonB-dependent receptor-like protein n=2 Tax=Arcticibacter pallidicorallinus TaxID=1259464 RepID=A0A2T0U0L0_9SPHI|nr:TonB-dependent receptor-like protein [Arcticibacter pallidicorallinus]
MFVFYNIFNNYLADTQKPVLFRLIDSMKQIFLSVLLVFPTFLSFSQKTPRELTIKGLIADSVNHRALGLATVTLLRTSTTSKVKSTITDADGKFELSYLSPGDYKLTVTLLGYKPLEIPVPKSEPTSGNAIDLSTLYVAPVLNDLGVVNISGFRPVVNQQADRIIYDVQADPESKANNALDMLRKVPLVSVDGAENIRLKGGSNYRMLINGKASSLISSNPSDLLKAMPADNIEKIEVITTPPSMYDAEGIAGIINIITQRKLGEGYSVNLTSTFNTVNGSSANVNAKLKRGKVGVQGFLGTAHPVEQNVATGYENAIWGPLPSQLLQDGRMISDRENSFGSAQFSFEADSLNLFTADLEYHTGGSSQQTQQVSTYFDQQMRINQSYELKNASRNKLRGTDFGFNHEHAFRRSKGQLLTSSYKYSYSRDAFRNDATYRNPVNYPASDFLQNNRSGSKEQTAQIDYVHPFKIVHIEVGAKGILRDNFSDFDRRSLDINTGVYRLDSDQTNDFTYKQNIYSLYNSYHLRWKDWDARAGLRLERSSVEADFSAANDPIRQRYTNLFPSLSAQRKLDGSNSLSLGYQQRLERPGILMLNPFTNYSNPGFLSSGNPDLDAVLNHSIDLIYSNYAKRPFTLGLNYTFANNTIESVTQVGEDKISRTSYRNVGQRSALGMLINSNFALSPKIRTNVDAQLMHVALSGFVDGQGYESEGFQWHIFSNTRYRFESGYRLGIDVSYDSRYVLLQGRDNDFLYYSINGSKDFFQDKVTLSVASSNFFNKYRRLDFTTRGRDFDQRRFYDIYYRRFNLRLVYKFGRLKEDIKKNQRGIRNDDQTSGRNNPS